MLTSATHRLAQFMLHSFFPGISINFNSLKTVYVLSKSPLIYFVEFPDIRNTESECKISNGGVLILANVHILALKSLF